MRRISLFLSMLVLVAMVLAACGGGATSTNVAASPPPVTVDVTETEAAAGTTTESPTEEGTATETAGIPVTGDVNPARISHQLDFTVWGQDGEQIGDVEDMVLNLDDSRVAYLIVGTGGFLDLGDREMLVPWESLELQTGTGDTTGGQQNVFILQTDVDTFRKAPDFDPGTLPEMGQPGADWDVDIRSYWENGGAGTGGEATNTPTAGTTVGDATATTDASAGTGQATATTAAGAGTGQATATTAAGQGTGTGTDQGQALQGVVLASEVLGSSINWGAQGQGTGTGQGNTTGTIEDMIVDVDTGDILYIVITADFAEGERWIPVPLSLFRWNGAAGAFTPNADTTVLQNAPAFENGQFPDSTTDGWNAEIDTFWQTNSGGGTGTGTGTDAQATAAP